jgi:hypothetical protein
MATETASSISLMAAKRTTIPFEEGKIVGFCVLHKT